MKISKLITKLQEFDGDLEISPMGHYGYGAFLTIYDPNNPQTEFIDIMDSKE